MRDLSLLIHNRFSTEPLTIRSANLLAHSAIEASGLVYTSNAWRVTLSTLRAMGRPLDVRQRWREVSLAAFEVFLREYPRALEPRPRLTPKSRHREWTDPTLGSWPANAVARCWTRGRCQGYEIRPV